MPTPESKRRQDEREKIALHGRTESAFQEDDFQDRHLEIVNTITMDGRSEIAPDYSEKKLQQIQHVMAKAIEQSSNAFRKFSGENALPVYKYPKSKKRDYEIPPEIYEKVLGKEKTIRKVEEPTKKQLKEKTAEYSEVMEITGPIAAKFAQELLDVAKLDEVDASELLNKLSFTDLMQYSFRKIFGETGNTTEKDLSETTQEEIETILSIVVPEENRWDFDNEVIDSINYDQNKELSNTEKKAMDLLFILMNQLWKVQQVHRAVFENRVSDEKLDSREPLSTDARISEERLEYQTYEGYLSDSYDNFSDESPLHGLVYSGYGVQKDLMIYLKN